MNPAMLEFQISVALHVYHQEKGLFIVIERKVFVRRQLAPLTA